MKMDVQCACWPSTRRIGCEFRNPLVLQYPGGLGHRSEIIKLLFLPFKVLTAAIIGRSRSPLRGAKVVVEVRLEKLPVFSPSDSHLPSPHSPPPTCSFQAAQSLVLISQTSRARFKLEDPCRSQFGISLFSWALGEPVD